MEVPAKPLREKVLIAEEQAALTPDQVIDILKFGNKHLLRMPYFKKPYGNGKKSGFGTVCQSRNTIMY